MDFLFMRSAALPPCSVQLVVESCQSPADLFQAISNIFMSGVQAKYGENLLAIGEKELQFLKECMQSVGITFTCFGCDKLVHENQKPKRDHISDYLLIFEMFEVCFRFDFFIDATSCKG